MNEFLRRIKLAEDFSIDLDISKTELTNKLTDSIEPEAVFASMFGKTTTLFIGNVDSNAISIRPKRSYGNSNYSYAAQLNATYSGNSQKVKIEGTLQISKKYFVMMLAPALFYFAVVIPLFVLKSFSLGMSIAVFVQFLFMIGIFYFILRKAIKISRTYFEKELFFLTKKN